MSDHIEHQPSGRLLDLIYSALDFGIESVRDYGGPMKPWLVVPGDDGRPTPTRMTAGSLEEGVAAARSGIAGLPAHVPAYAITADGILPTDGERFDAIIVEAGERGGSVGFIFAQRYRHADAVHEFEVVGRPAMLREVPNRFADAPIEK